MIDTKKCLVCLKRNSTLHWHKDPDSGDMWVWCNGPCQRGYSLRSYCHHAGISLPEFLKGEFDFKEAANNELTAMNWPAKFIPLSDPRAHPAIDYIKSRGLSPEGDMYYDIEKNGVVFPYYWENYFVGAQIRFIVPRVHSDGEVQKIDTMLGTRLGLLFYSWNQARFIGNVKAVVICEGAFNSLSLQQAFNDKYGGVANNPWRFLATSGCNLTAHHKEALKNLKDQGLTVICAYDNDDAGLKGLKKAIDAECITHYSIPGCTEDWNDLAKVMSHGELASYFFSRIQKIDV
jgi:hypothetical protein